jgi:transposase
MAGQATFKRHTVEERQRVLDAYRSGDDWRAVAAHNAIPPTSAYNIVASGRVEPLPRGGARHTRVTPEIKASLETYLEECCSYTLSTMRTLILDDHNVELSLSTISLHLLGMLYTVKQV